MGKKLGFTIPFTKKWHLKRKIKGLESELKKTNEKFCNIADRVETAKEDAARILVKREYDSVTQKLDDTLEEATECARGAAETPEAGASGKLPSGLKSACSEKLFNRKQAGRKGWTSEERKKINECVAKNQGVWEKRGDQLKGAKR